jgi:hypothetical protein
MDGRAPDHNTPQIGLPTGPDSPSRRGIGAEFRMVSAAPPYGRAGLTALVSAAE